MIKWTARGERRERLLVSSTLIQEREIQVCRTYATLKAASRLGPFDCERPVATEPRLGATDAPGCIVQAQGRGQFMAQETPGDTD